MKTNESTEKVHGKRQRYNVRSAYSNVYFARKEMFISAESASDRNQLQ